MIVYITGCKLLNDGSAELLRVGVPSTHYAVTIMGNQTPWMRTLHVFDNREEAIDVAKVIAGSNNLPMRDHTYEAYRETESVYARKNGFGAPPQQDD